MLNLKYKFLYYKKIPLKSIYLVIICNLTHLQDGYKGEKNIRKSSYGVRIRIRNQQKSRIRIRKNILDPQHCKIQYSLN
jgi:hypothetical protein